MTVDQTPPGPVTAALIIIGDEILSGRTKDANLPYLAEWLNGQGIQLAEARVVPDREDEIASAVNALRARYAYVFTTGGIGPTHDDITAQSIAKAFGVPLLRNQEAVARLAAHYKTAEELTEARLRMANVPDGASLIDNPVSSAPGFRMDNVFVMAGVPKIMQAMLDTLAGTLVGGQRMASVTVSADGVAESRLAPDLARIEGAHQGISVGSYPRWLPSGGYGVSIVVRGFDTAVLDIAADEVAEAMRALGGDPKRGA